ncbi:hypothetical protein HDU81_002256 [Chytriomyces hyalinus]|nr:hypothetical protein HDU81_002256 [Chytriomyces hyalinus]
MVDSPTGFCVPDALANDLQKWFENAMARQLRKPISLTTSEEAATILRKKESRSSEQMELDAHSLLPNERAKIDKNGITGPAPETATHQQNIYYGASGLRLTKYNAILVDIMPAFKTLSRKARVAVKRGVKFFLPHGMGDRFRECIFIVEGAEHHTYGVPDDLLAGFRDWAVTELGRCFPDKMGLE